MEENPYQPPQEVPREQPSRSWLSINWPFLCLLIVLFFFLIVNPVIQSSAWLHNAIDKIFTSR